MQLWHGSKKSMLLSCTNLRCFFQRFISSADLKVADKLYKWKHVMATKFWFWVKLLRYVLSSQHLVFSLKLTPSSKCALLQSKVRLFKNAQQVSYFWHFFQNTYESFLQIFWSTDWWFFFQFDVFFCFPKKHK